MVATLDTLTLTHIHTHTHKHIYTLPQKRRTKLCSTRHTDLSQMISSSTIDNFIPRCLVGFCEQEMDEEDLSVTLGKNDKIIIDADFTYQAYPGIH